MLNFQGVKWISTQVLMVKEFYWTVGEGEISSRFMMVYVYGYDKPSQ